MRCDAIDIDSQMKVEESSGKGVCHVLITRITRTVRRSVEG